MKKQNLLYYLYFYICKNIFEHQEIKQLSSAAAAIKGHYKTLLS